VLKGKQQSKQDAYVTNLLISLLMRFPEIMAINFDMPKEKCKFTFMLQGNVSKDEYFLFKGKLSESLAAFGELTSEQLTVSVKLIRSGKINLMEITSSTDSLCLEAIQLITSLLDMSFPQIIIKDMDILDTVRDEEMLRQEEIIEYLLSHTTGTKKENLIAFRESGKVYVYDK
jgi:hypothetical protein